MIEATTGYVNAMIEREARRSHVKHAAAQELVARRLGEARGAIANLRSGRLKNLSFRLCERVRQAFIREMEAEIARLTHEVEVARQMGVRPDADEMLAAQSLLSQARALIEGN